MSENPPALRTSAPFPNAVLPTIGFVGDIVVGAVVLLALTLVLTTDPVPVAAPEAEALDVLFEYS